MSQNFDTDFLIILPALFSGIYIAYAHVVATKQETKDSLNYYYTKINKY